MSSLDPIRMANTNFVSSHSHHSQEMVSIGSYVILQREQFFKVHQVSATSDSFTLGKDKVDIKPIIGKAFWSIFRMVRKKGNKREFSLEVCDKAESLSEDVMKDVVSGNDNRNITDDGNAQLLSTEEICELRNSGLSPKNIVGKLIENSKTFSRKTEYSQEKYLKKKEKKYSEFIIIRKPTIRLLSEIYYSRDQSRILGLRYDTLSQIITLANIQSEGVYLLFESGTQALMGAAVMNYLSDKGVLINISLGNQPQKQAILAMNYGEEKLENCICVKASSLISSLNPDKNLEHSQNSDQESTEINQNSASSASDTRKRKTLDDDESDLTNKKPRWAYALERACNILKTQKADGLIIACREFPLKLIISLLPYVLPSRPIVIYSLFREPLIELYVELKKRKDVVALHLTETWLRSYQVLPDRTHPDVLMSASGGHILSGIIIDPS